MSNHGMDKIPDLFPPFHSFFLTLKHAKQFFSTKLAIFGNTIFNSYLGEVSMTFNK